MATSAATYLPERLSLSTMREAAEHCRGCELYKNATQVVFGRGLKRARVMLIGEIPGDQEDRQGKPFVGPAGGLLRSAMEKAGLELTDTYLTNVVKHFNWEPRGKRRLHKKPSARHIKACLPWLEAEIEVVQPAIIVCLGATAAQALLGPKFRITKQRGKFIENHWAPKLVASYHPSAILRARTEDERQKQRSELVSDLRLAVTALNGTD
jgi:uracil-DNA glycosylase family protein